MDRRIDGLGGDIFETFITPQVLLGCYAAYLARSRLKNRKGYENISFRNLKYRFLYGAAKDVMETFELLGWVAPIFSSDEILPSMLVPVDVDNPSSKDRKDSLVYYSQRKGCQFATNIPALIELLIFWLCRNENLVATLITKSTYQKAIITMQRGI